MLREEFEALTKRPIDIKEYHYVEESYMESDLDKVDFCKEWLNKKRQGFWDIELMFRIKLDCQSADFKNKLAEKDEQIEFWQNHYMEKINR